MTDPADSDEAWERLFTTLDAIEALLGEGHNSPKPLRHNVFRGRLTVRG